MLAGDHHSPASENALETPPSAASCDSTERDDSCSAAPGGATARANTAARSQPTGRSALVGWSKDRSSAARLDSLTGLRFAAAFAVLLFHMGVLYLSTPLGTLRHVMVQGFVGVSFFFILSGFVLTWSHRDGDPTAGFYRRRLAKIGPLQVATWVLVGVLLFTLGTLPSKRDALASLVLAVPWIPRLTAHLPMNGPNWSLGCEIFFYALFPLLVLPLRRFSLRSRRALLFASIVAVVLIAIAVTPVTPGTPRYWFLYYFPPVRMLEFVFGALLALEVKDGTLPNVNLRFASLLALATYVADSWAPMSLQPVALTLVPFGLLIVACAQTDLAGRPSPWRSRAMVTLGLWSFALYMVQAAVFFLIGHAIHGTLNDLEAAVVGVGVVVTSIAAAGFLYKAVEHPLELWLRSVTFHSLRHISLRRGLDTARQRLGSMRPSWARSPLLWLASSALAVVGLSAVASAIPAAAPPAATALGGPVASAAERAASPSPNSASRSGSTPGQQGANAGSPQPTTATGAGSSSTNSISTSVAWYQSYAQSQLRELTSDFASCEEEAHLGSSPTTFSETSSNTVANSPATSVGSVTQAMSGSAPSTPGAACEALSAAATAAADGTSAPGSAVEEDWQSYLHDDIVFAQVAGTAATDPTPALQTEAHRDAQQAEQALTAMQELLGVS